MRFLSLAPKRSDQGAGADSTEKEDEEEEGRDGLCDTRGEYSGRVWDSCASLKGEALAGLQLSLTVHDLARPKCCEACMHICDRLFGAWCGLARERNVGYLADGQTGLSRGLDKGGSIRLAVGQTRSQDSAWLQGNGTMVRSGRWRGCMRKRVSNDFALGPWAGWAWLIGQRHGLRVLCERCRIQRHFWPLSGEGVYMYV